jgi:hypothetical protein
MFYTGIGLSIAGGGAAAWSEWDGTHNARQTTEVGVTDSAINIAAGAVAPKIGIAAASLMGAEDGAELGTFAGPEGTLIGAAVGAAGGAVFSYFADNAANWSIGKWF